ncbi:MAG TPA: hypothetical protein QF417_05970, partial [Acidimicrobiales bacterium]|nr:hypothetical protein [Acidimicrobiales bacterium]
MTSATEAGLRRTWPQRLLLAFSVVFAVSLLYVTARLDQFEESVSSIIRIDVPAGVLADLPGTESTASGGQGASGVGGSNNPGAETGDSGGAGVPGDVTGDGPGGPDTPPGYGPPRPPPTPLPLGNHKAGGLGPGEPAAQRDTPTGGGPAHVIML